MRLCSIHAHRESSTYAYFADIEPYQRMNAMLSRFMRLLETRRAFVLLLALNALMVGITLWLSRDAFLSDGWTYLGLAEGLLHGRYSMWWPLEAHYPDTFRAPGYPLFIAVFIKLSGSWHTVLVVQFLLYWVALFLTLKVIERYDPRRSTRSLFLLFLLPLMNVPYYIAQLYTEIPVLAALSMVLYLIARPGRWSIPTALSVGALLAFTHLCKPIYVLLPFAITGCALLLDKRSFDMRGHLIMISTFALLILPYGIWSLRNHGVFKVTPIQGSGGYMHFAYWCGKMPGYRDHISLGNFTGDELVRFTPEDSIPAHIAAFEKEWADINTQLAPLMTRKDSIMLNSRDLLPYIAEPTYNTRYSIERERLLNEHAIRRMWNDPWYTLAYKSYSAVRLWVIGIQRAEFARASMGRKIQMLYGTLSTGFIFVLAFIAMTWAYLRRVIRIRDTWPFLLLILYTGVLHVPFTIQSRYTVCVRFAMLALTALACAALFRERDKTPCNE